MEMIYIYYVCTFWTGFNQVKYLELIFFVSYISNFQHHVTSHDKAMLYSSRELTEKYFCNIQDKINDKPCSNRIDHAILTVLIV